jgi:hypothetical protein
MIAGIVSIRYLARYARNFFVLLIVWIEFELMVYLLFQKIAQLSHHEHRLVVRGALHVFG